MKVSLSGTVCSVEEPALRVYLLGRVEFDAALAFQRRMAFEVGGDNSQAALLLCEHSSLITIGRQGSHTHLLADGNEWKSRRWQIRWVNRGGGCFLHVPGQLAIYPILSLAHWGLSLVAYRERLQQVIKDVLRDFGISGVSRSGHAGVWVGERPIAGIGVSVRDWVAYYGAVFNIDPALDPFRLVQCCETRAEPMTSLVRERRGPLRPALVRERFLEHFQNRFGFGRIALFSDHPLLNSKARSDAFATHS